MEEEGKWPGILREVDTWYMNYNDTDARIRYTSAEHWIRKKPTG